MDAEYQLIYWPIIAGRGEFIRLPLEATQTPYLDVARDPERKGIREVVEFLHDERAIDVYACPVLLHGDRVIAHVANILAYLAPRIAMVPNDEDSRLRANQLQLSITDAIVEAHNTHHPISTALTYEDQADACLRAARLFIDERLHQWLAYFERISARVEGDWIFGDRLSYIDTSLFQLIEGLRYAFPKAIGRTLPDHPRLERLMQRVADLPAIASYLASDRRLAFNEDGVFRHYPPLDL